ncbi:hypothetical protein TNCV_3612531, partial [Trichonephila clavipes]
ALNKRFLLGIGLLTTVLNPILIELGCGGLTKVGFHSAEWHGGNGFGRWNQGGMANVLARSGAANVVLTHRLPSINPDSASHQPTWNFHRPRMQGHVSTLAC